MARAGNCHNVADFERWARKRLPAPLYHYIAGGADDEGMNSDLKTLSAYFGAKMERNITWAAIERIAAHWGGLLQ